MCPYDPTNIAGFCLTAPHGCKIGQNKIYWSSQIAKHLLQSRGFLIKGNVWEFWRNILHSFDKI